MGFLDHLGPAFGGDEQEFVMDNPECQSLQARFFNVLFDRNRDFVALEKEEDALFVLN
jgi:hypothetical protein